MPFPILQIANYDILLAKFNSKRSGLKCQTRSRDKASSQSEENPKKKKKLIAHHIFLIVQCFPFMNNLPNNVIEDYYFIPRGNNRVHILTTQKLAIARNGGVRG